MSVKLVTLGCRLNTYESEVMRAHAEGAGLTNVIIVNSCAVTGEAERQTRQAIRRAKRENPAAQVIVTGCAAQLDPAAFSAMPEVDRVLGNAEKLTAEAWQKTSTQKVLVADIAEARETAGHLLSGFGGRTRAFLQVQQGCDHRCTFCIIPFGRGPSRSSPVGQVVEEARRLTEAGVKEIVLTGVDITDYGKDLPGKPSLGDLARRLLKLVPDLPRLRLSSLDPSEIDEATYDLLANEPRLMPHLHLSVQAGNDLILKRMKRRHLSADVIKATQRARRLRPDLVIGADFIAGFPTESEDAFADTLRLVEEAGLTFLHVFPYSARKGTPAARMPQVPVPVRKERAARLRELGARQEAAFLSSRIGQSAQVLIEEEGLGRSEHYAPVEIAGRPGSLIAARLTAVSQKHLVGIAA